MMVSVDTSSIHSFSDAVHASASWIPSFGYGHGKHVNVVGKACAFCS